MSVNQIRWTKIVPFALLVTMLGGVAAGCSSGTNNDGNAGGSETEAAVSETGYPITDEPITLQVWAPIHPNATQYIKSYSENEAYMELEKRTGIKIEFIHPAQGQEQESFNLMIASGEVPDIIIGANRYVGGANKGVRDGVFADLTPYLEQYAPDYYKLVTTDEEVKRQVTNDEGGFPAFYMIKPEQDPPFRRIILREETLKSVQMEEPRTIEDYEKFFKAVKESKGVAPYALLGSGLEDQFMGPFGVVSNFFLKDESTVAFGQTEPAFREYLTLMNKWYTEGYINKDFAGLKTPQVLALFDSGKAEMYVDAIVGSFNRGKQLGQTYVSAPYPRVNPDDKVRYMPLEQVAQPGQETVVAASSKHIKEAIRWLNYAYSEEGAMLFNYGIEGKTYNMVDGKPQYTDYILNNPKFGTDNANFILKVHFAPKLQYTDIASNPNLAKSPESAAIRMKWADDPNVDSSMFLPTLQLTSEESDERAKIMTEVNTYCNEMVLKFILGVEPLSKFDDYVSQVKKLGIDKAVSLTQAAYDRYLTK
ncbi:extracellular solute-binding protein [Paenibacillus arenilitoris]|uniref:Extracellular solute-binding protein n=1 Tax=Paenibacillus arenilitoris TaxID=2772299 RepID=A0A927H614_9BACL|nr:extracellular solute-binding protein [Paenibacillus arenilitoris]MBD2869012.1 extracellular solute-binding protein [Paenibacillus arenilitoris]